MVLSKPLYSVSCFTLKLSLCFILFKFLEHSHIPFTLTKRKRELEVTNPFLAITVIVTVFHFHCHSLLAHCIDPIPLLSGLSQIHFTKHPNSCTIAQISNLVILRLLTEKRRVLNSVKHPKASA